MQACYGRYHVVFFFFQAEDGIRDYKVTGVQTCALPISQEVDQLRRSRLLQRPKQAARRHSSFPLGHLSGQGVSLRRSEEHTSELQSPCNLVCRLLLEKKKRHISRTTSFQVRASEGYSIT